MRAALRTLQAVAVLGLVAGVSATVIDSVCGPRPFYDLLLPAPAASTEELARRQVGRVTDGVGRLLGPGVLFAVCEIALALRRWPGSMPHAHHPESDE